MVVQSIQELPKLIMFTMEIGIMENPTGDLILRIAKIARLMICLVTHKRVLLLIDLLPTLVQLHGIRS